MKKNYNYIHKTQEYYLRNVLNQVFEKYTIHKLDIYQEHDRSMPFRVRADLTGDKKEYMAILENRIGTLKSNGKDIFWFELCIMGGEEDDLTYYVINPYTGNICNVGDDFDELSKCIDENEEKEEKEIVINFYEKDLAEKKYLYFES